MMKIALSSALLPGLNFEQIVRRAGEWGYDGLMLVALHGHFEPASRWPVPAALDAARALCDENEVAIAAIHSSMSFCDRDEVALRGGSARVAAAIALAGQIGCPHVVVSGGRVVGRHRLRGVEQTAAVLQGLSEQAAAAGVRLLFENAGDLSSSQDAWHVADAAGSGTVGVLLDPLAAWRAGEPPSVSIPRLGGMLCIVRVADAAAGPDGRPAEPTAPGLGGLGVARVVELLKGIAFRGWLCVDWPPEQTPELELEKVLPATAELLRSEIARPVVELSAYKGDKNAPRFVSGASG